MPSKLMLFDVLELEYAYMVRKERADVDYSSDYKIDDCSY